MLPHNALGLTGVMQSREKLLHLNAECRHKFVHSQQGTDKYPLYRVYG